MPCEYVYEIDSGERHGAEVGGRHLWVVISDPAIASGDGLVIALPLTGRDEKRSNYDIPFRPDDIEELRPPQDMKLKSEGLCYVLAGKPRHFAVSRLPPSPFGRMASSVVHQALQRMGSAILLRVSPM